MVPGAVAPPPSRAAPAPTTPPAATPTTGYRVTLQSGEGGAAELSAPVPAAFQDLTVFTTRREVDGRVIHETHLGPFATLAAAEAAAAQLRARFPQAVANLATAPTTVAAAAPSAPTAVTAPAAPAPAPAATPASAAPATAAPATAAAPAAPAAPAPVVTPAAPATPVAPTAPAAPPAPSAPASAPAVAPPPAPAASAPAAPAAAPILAQAPAAPASAAPVPTPPAEAASAAIARPPLASPEVEAGAAALMTQAREALVRKEGPAAVEALHAVLALPANASSREAQALIGEARLLAGDSGRAQAEFEQFLRQYPEGADADRVRAALVALAPPPAETAPSGRRVRPSTTLTGSVSAYYYGGQSKVRTQEFQDSPLSGLPELVSDATLSNTDQSQWITNADVNWRHRDEDVDQRFVFRDTYLRDQLRPEKSRNRLNALYYDQRSFSSGFGFRVGRQTPLGDGVLGRFDGAQVGYAFRPRWKVRAVAGVPTDDLLDTKRYFYGAALEGEALTPQLGASVYGIEQKIDGETDRRAIGTELRYFDGGLSGTAQFDYDVVLKGLNIATVQGTWQAPDNTVVNALYDQRTAPLMMLGNVLFFIDPSLPVRPTRIGDLLATTSIEALRERARQITARSTQAALGFTKPVAEGWQVGMDIRYTNTGEVAPVPDILPNGLPSTGDIWSLSGQVIGTNLFSERDTHVLVANALTGPTFEGQFGSYNASLFFNGLQLEPSIKLYRQSDASGLKSTRWAPGLRVTYRVLQQLALESELTVENSSTRGPNRDESARRTFYYLGGRYEF